MSSPGSPTSRRPERPEYGEYATPEEQAAQRGTPEVAPQPPAAHPPLAPTVLRGRAPGSGDRLASQLLLVLGALGLGMALSAAFVFDDAMVSVYLQYGIHEPFVPNDATRAAQYALGASHIVLYLIALFGTGRLLRSGRRAFWFPLAIGVLAAAVYFGIWTAVSFGDPYLLEAVQHQLTSAG